MPIRPSVLAKAAALAAMLGLAIAAPALAETPSQPAPDKTSPEKISADKAAPERQAENAPLQLQLCVKDNPAIDYRACVNASTRDLSRKIRQA